jgi:hypothetical protein
MPTRYNRKLSPQLVNFLSIVVNRPGNSRSTGAFVGLKDRPIGEETRAGGLKSEADGGHDSADQCIGMARGGSDVSSVLQARERSIHVSPRHTDFKQDQFGTEGLSIGRRMFRALARFGIAVLIGIGATLAWQSHGEEAKELVRTWAPSLGWLLSVSTTKSPAGAPLTL